MTDLSSSKILFESRSDAGRQLAAELVDYKDASPLVLAIPNGGVPLAFEIARSLDAGFGLVVSRKLPLPLSPEGGFGAVTDDGTVILSEEIVKKAGISQKQIDDITGQVRGEVLKRSLLYRKDRPLPVVHGKTVILVDDGLASGLTMLAAVESVRRRNPATIVVAIPVSAVAALEQVEKKADKVVTLARATMPRFYIADFYRIWRDVSEADTLSYLDQYEMRRFTMRNGAPHSNTPDQPARRFF